MTLRTLLFVLVFGALGAFVVANWAELTRPAELSLVVTQVQGPAGLVMLGFVGAVAVAFLAYVGYLLMSGLLETRRHGKELQTQRQLADQAEASRFTELRAFLEAEFARGAALGAERDAALRARLDAVERQLQTAIDLQANSLAASVGDLADRVERARDA